MSKTNSQTYSLIENRLSSMQAGFQKDFTPKQSLPVDGTPMTQQAIIGQIGSYLQILSDVAGARNALAVKIAAKKAAMPAIHKLLSDLEIALKFTLGSKNPLLPDFGIQPPKSRKKPDSQTKALAAAAAKSTKRARGIIGKNQRAQITAQGKPGLALVDAQGNVLPDALTGPLPPGSRTPLRVVSVALDGAAAPESAAPSSEPANGTAPASGK